MRVLQERDRSRFVFNLSLSLSLTTRTRSVRKSDRWSASIDRDGEEDIDCCNLHKLIKCVDKQNN